MQKRNYTHVQEVLPEIKAMIQAGKSQREIAEYFGFKDKYVVEELLKLNIPAPGVFFVLSAQYGAVHIITHILYPTAILR